MEHLRTTASETKEKNSFAFKIVFVKDLLWSWIISFFVYINLPIYPIELNCNCKSQCKDLQHRKSFLESPSHE